MSFVSDQCFLSCLDKMSIWGFYTASNVIGCIVVMNLEILFVILMPYFLFTCVFTPEVPS